MIRIAACQLTPGVETEARKVQMYNVLEKARNIDFVCFPEGFLTGYYAKESLARKNSLEVGGTALEGWLEITRGYTSTVVVGFNEREGDAIFDSAAIIENGKLLGIQRKHYLYHSYFTPGTSFLSFHSKGVTFGVAICLDTNYFEPARLLALQGASILFSPMCNRVAPDHRYAKRPPYYSHFVARSFENRCWLVTADWIWPEECPGHTVIYDPDGQEVCRSQEGTEQVLTFEIPRNRLLHEKGRRVHGSPVLQRKLNITKENL